ncbi:MAG: type II and III secretion system protein, partial [Planctomycetes bacterium]|nr:type II and III secretion system protein [Planctomycetota bacterium]
LFSEKAFLGPNGTVQGPEFDFVLGTDLGAVGSGGGIAFTMTGEDFNFLFHALQSKGRAELISRPSLLVKDNEEGVIEIITEVPVPTQSGADNAGNPITAITYEDAGITLTVTPHINPDGFVQLEIEPEVSSIGASAVVGSISAPTFNRTRLSTTVTVKDGETIIIGGLIETFLSETESYVPWLGEIPYLGALFSADEKTKRSKELLVVITATVLRTEEDAYRISVEQRDKTGIIPDSIKENPLMNKLQVRPADDELGEDEREFPPDEDEDDDFYGPRPSAYGPEIPSRVQPASYEEEE